MIISHLTKIYKERKNEVIAVNDVSFNLPKSGLIFILGKSGSGKTTLLNCLGGIDEATSGDVIIGNKHFSSFTDRDYDDYRNNYLGFIFQDFYLMDKLTAFENVRVSLDLKGINDDKRVDEILDKVELSEFKDKYPLNLSGGQCQRVAIARALVKEPKLILADEPTGNLDSKTSLQIFELLKKLSKDVLIVVVSHSVSDAYKYGDRIIELSDGKIVSDIVKDENYKDEIIIKDKVAHVPSFKKLSDSDIKELSDGIKEGAISSIKENGDGFKENKETKHLEEDVTFDHKKIGKGRLFLTSFKFLKRKLVSCILTTIISSILIVLFGLSQTFVKFNLKDAVDSAMSKSDEPSFVLTKGFVDDDIFETFNKNYFVEISYDEVKNFRDNYNGNVYERVPTPFVTTNSFSIGFDNGKYVDVSVNFSEFYAKESYGTVICNQEFLTKLFHDGNGELNYTGTLSKEENKGGIIITDYLADCLIYYSFFVSPTATYDDLIGLIINNNRVEIIGVIDTGYKEKYANLISSIKEGGLKKSDELGEFVEYAKNYLAVSYSINPSFKEDFINCGTWKFIRLGCFEVDDLDGNNLYYASSCFHSFELTNDDIKDDEIYLTPLFYNMLFDTNITSAKSEEYIDKQKINIIFYEPGRDIISYEKTFTIVGIVGGEYGKVNSNALKEMQREKIFYTYSLYFDNYSDVYNVYELSGGEDSLYYFESNDFNIINNLAKAVTIFSDFFVLIEVALCVIVVLTICSFSFSSVRKSREDIGILRALGARSVSVASIFVFQILLIGILISLISSVLLCTILPVANKLIVGNFSNFSTSVVTSYLTVLKYYPSVLIINILVTISATVLSSFAPFIAVSHVKPIEIIKSKE